jgi:HrpA-like RNA helicase
MLATVNISQSSAKQRKGRSGRTRPGKCYRMCTEKYFDSLEFIRKREIQRISPDGLILDLLSRKLEVEEIVSDNAISIETIKESKTRLATIGLLTDDNLSVTLAGNWIKNTPLSPRGGMFFWLWAIYSEYNPFIGAVLTAILETHNGGYFYVGEFDPPIETILKKKFLPVINDLKASYNKSSFFFNVSLIMYIISTFRSIEISPRELKNYCQENYLNNTKIKECFKVIKLLASKKSNGPVSIGNFDIDYEISKAEPYLYQSYSDMSYSGTSKRHKLKTEIDTFLEAKDKISNRRTIIPLSSFETEYKTFVSLYHTIENPPLFKISLKKD